MKLEECCGATNVRRRMLREGTWLCEGPLDEGNFVAKAN
jgi:hypothetical protein